MSTKKEPGTVTRGLIKLELDYSIRDFKNNFEKSVPQVRTQCYIQGEDLALPNTTLSQGQWFQSANTVIKEEVSTSNVPSDEKGYHDNIGVQQKEGTSVRPSFSQSSNSHNTDTYCETKSQLLQNLEEFYEHSSQTVPKCEPTMSTNTNTDNESFFLRDVKDFQTSLLTDVNVLPNQQERVKLYKCGTCSYSCNFLYDLWQHNISHRKEHFYICDLCQISYQYFLDLKDHLVSHAVTDEISYQVLDDSKEMSRKENSRHQHEKKHSGEKLLYSCDLCGYRCVSLREVSYHMTGHNRPYSCNLCDSFDRTPHDVKLHRRKHTGDKPYSCDICDYTCGHVSWLKQHIRRHTGEKPYSCDLCDYTCAQQSNLQRHKLRHAGEKPYSCDLCNYTCTLSSSLKRHKRRHTGVRLHSCDLCDYSCTKLSFLKKHRRRHTGEKPYSCDLCDYTCAQLSYLKRHKLRHPGEKPYSCDLCNYTCTLSSSLKRHKRKHTGKRLHSCDLCDYSCTKLSVLKNHRTRHTGEKPYSCDLCDYTCAQLRYLKRHKLRHTGERSHACDLCDYTCAVPKTLKNHKIRRHAHERLYLSPEKVAPKDAKICTKNWQERSQISTKFVNIAPKLLPLTVFFLKENAPGNVKNRTQKWQKIAPKINP